MINDRLILIKAKEYYDKIEEAYKVAIEMEKSAGKKYFREKMSQYSDIIYSVAPTWLIASLETYSRYLFEIISKQRKK